MSPSEDPQSELAYSARFDDWSNWGCYAIHTALVILLPLSAWTEHGSGPAILSYCYLPIRNIVFFVVTLCSLGLVVSVALMSTPALRQKSNWAAKLCVIGVGGLAASMMFTNELIERAWRGVPARMQPLNGAIRAYESKTGQLPQSLHQLVPEFLDSIPGTGMRCAPTVGYLPLSAPRGDESVARGWQLIVASIPERTGERTLIFNSAGASKRDSMYFGEWSYADATQNKG